MGGNVGVVDRCFDDGASSWLEVARNEEQEQEQRGREGAGAGAEWKRDQE